MESIHIVVDALVHGLDPAGNKDLPLHLPGLGLAGQPFQLPDKLFALILGDELAGLHRIHQQLEFRQFKGAAAQIVPAAPAPAQFHIYPAGPQGLDIVVDALALGPDPLGFQCPDQLGHAERVILIGFSFQNILQHQELGLLAFLPGHGGSSSRGLPLYFRSKALRLWVDRRNISSSPSRSSVSR